MMSDFVIDGRKIGSEHPPYIIAEMSANHNGSINNAYKIIDMAKVAGADALKLQTYKPETITMDMNTPEFMIDGGLWDGQSLYKLYEDAFMPWKWHKSLFQYGVEEALSFFTPAFFQYERFTLTNWNIVLV